MKQTWGQYGLTLPGRIRIAKCFVYGQVNYHGLLAELNKDDLQQIERMIAWFVSGRSRIAHDKIFSSTSEGGLGLPTVKNILLAQRARLWTVASDRDDLWRDRYIERVGGPTGRGQLNGNGCSQANEHKGLLGTTFLGTLGLSRDYDKNWALFQFWADYGLPNSLGEFIFGLTTNRLPLNASSLRRDIPWVHILPIYSSTAPV